MTNISNSTTSLGTDPKFEASREANSTEVTVKIGELTYSLTYWQAECLAQELEVALIPKCNCTPENIAANCDFDFLKGKGLY